MERTIKIYNILLETDNTKPFDELLLKYSDYDKLIKLGLEDIQKIINLKDN